ncbi:hypothetical protein EXA20_16405 [Vibrio cincinnatiensis]|uniref:hypothetical protein n=1 Tax=Vibrio cincinnatiensis TaxID=675 RepID=UPI001EDE0A78|nr:hypothetical protein [Vibrio cincinnatiensis]MCG3748560.1 hypothetical protein [Vibrio cincinnatiensis]
MIAEAQWHVDDAHYVFNGTEYAVNTGSLSCEEGKIVLELLEVYRNKKEENESKMFELCRKAKKHGIDKIIFDRNSKNHREFNLCEMFPE